MRLLDTTTITLHTFSGGSIPPYAILSHRWDEVEVSFDDLQNGRYHDMPGYAKIRGCCAQANLDGWKYVWIDSCCIDKSSSAELSESINSMFQWYRDAQVCYAFLSDVNGSDDIAYEMRRSAWFTRGWTLQELLAPASLVFFDANWNDIGTKCSLEEIISEITGVEDFVRYKQACVAQKMSWASRRKTTRVEDEAYCLMGLFDVNMPLLYGEGEGAFMRLQLEIIKASDDQSIFAWYSGYTGGGLLAMEPRDFEHSSQVRLMDRSNFSDFDGRELPFQMTNRGLHISLYLLPAFGILQSHPLECSEKEVFMSPLRCSRAGEANTRQIIFLVREAGRDGDTLQRMNDPDHESAIPPCRPAVLTETQIEAESMAWDWAARGIPVPSSRLVYIPQRLSPFKPSVNTAVSEYNISIDVTSLLQNRFDTFWQVPNMGAIRQSLIHRPSDTTKHETKQWLHLPPRFRDPWFSSTNELFQLKMDKKDLQQTCVEIYLKSPGGKTSLLLVVGISKMTGQLWVMLISWNDNMKWRIVNQGGVSHFSRIWAQLQAAPSTCPSESSKDYSRSILHFPRQGKEEVVGVDRISKSLPNGRSIDVSVRLIPGDARSFLVKCDMSTTPPSFGSASKALRWPEPIWLSDLEDEIARKIVIFDKVEQGLVDENVEEDGKWKWIFDKGKEDREGEWKWKHEADRDKVGAEVDVYAGLDKWVGDERMDVEEKEFSGGGMGDSERVSEEKARMDGWV